MYNVILSRAIFPVLDTLNRTQISKVLKFLEESQWWPVERLFELQETKLLKILSWTRPNSTFYKEHWKTAPEERWATSLYPELNGLPIVNKEDLRAQSHDFPLPSFTGRFLTVNTSGSTGVPMTFLRSGQQESWFWALRFRIWQWAGYNLGDPYLTINLNSRLAWKKKLQDFLFRCSYLTYNANNLNSEQIVERLKSKRITHLNGFSSSLYVLASYMNQKGISNPSVKAITATGDTLFPSYRKVIEEQFGVEVTDYYGAGGEGMHLASQCEHGRYHIHAENSIVEIITDGRPAKAGELGRIVVTQLDNYAMPLIRYDLDDTAVQGDVTPCPCRRAHPALRSVQGRVYDIVYAPNGSALLPHFFVVAFKNLQEVHRYQIVQEEENGILLKLVPKAGCNQRRCEQTLRSDIAKVTGGSLETKFSWVDEIPLAGAGKRRIVVSKLGTRLRDRLPTRVS